MERVFTPLDCLLPAGTVSPAAVACIQSGGGPGVACLAFASRADDGLGVVPGPPGAAWELRNGAARAWHVSDRVLLSERLLLPVKRHGRSDGPNGACYPGLK